MDKVREKLRALFSGHPTTIGTWDKGQALTVQDADVDKAWQDHFDGKVGIGQIPIIKDSNKWGAIDLDFYDGDRNKRGATTEELTTILEKIESLPLYAFQSKSGSIHLYIFYKTKKKCKHIREVLAGYAKELDCPDAEIFPKQERISDNATGSWINIPYFGMEERCNVVNDGKLRKVKPEEFLESVKLVEKEPVKELPPCIEKLLEVGVQQGSRNNFIYNIGVLNKKRFPDSWQEETRKFNYTFFDVPIDDRKLKDTIKALGRKKYNYNCDEHPICDYCNKDLCQSRLYGVSGAVYSDIEIGKLKRVGTSPVTYYLDVNGKDIELTTIELVSFKLVRLKIIDSLSILPANRKAKDWEGILSTLLDDVIHEDTPIDASNEGAAEVLFFDYLETMHGAESREDIVRGKPFEENGFVHFRSKDAVIYMKSQGMNLMKESDLFKILRKFRLRSRTMSINGKSINAWRVPIEFVNEQTSKFTEKEFQDEM